MVQRAGGAAVLVLVLTFLLLKQRKAKGMPATASSSDAPKATKPKKRPAAVKENKKGRSFGVSRKRTGGDAVDEPVAGPKSSQGRMVPRLPAPSEVAAIPSTLEPVSFPELATSSEPAQVAIGANGMINEPGWPTPGEVWAAPDTSVRESGGESWQAEAQDDPLVALATDASETFDPTAGWDAPSEDASTAPAGPSDATWQAEEETFDWTAGDAIDGWATSDVSAPAEELASGAAAWESPEDETPSWSTPDTSEWETAEQVEETPAVATAVAEEFNVGDWSSPAEETVAEETETVVEAEAVEEISQIVWDPVDEIEDADEPAEIDPAREPEAVVESAPDVHAEPVVETAPDPVVFAPVMEADPVVEAAPDPVVFAPVMEAEPVLADEPVTEPEAAVEIEPFGAFESVIEAGPVHELDPVMEPEPVMAYGHMAEVAAPTGRPYVVVLPEMPEVDDDAVVQDRHMASSVAGFAVAVPAAAAAADPVSRWASMAPGGAVRERITSNPASSWARLRPGQIPATEVPPASGNHSVGLTATTPAPHTAPSLAWWDVPSGMESDPRRGRFALGGYALQAGHQVVSGVTFRDGVVPPPTHWVIGPVVGQVAPGTLVLHVDGLLNCRSEDLSVLTDPGFAPTTDGFSLRLAGAATGPFAASGTYIIT